VTEQPPSRARRVGTVVLVVTTIVLTFFSAFAMWLRSLVLNTDAYVRAVGPVLENQQLRDALADEIVGQLYQHVDVAELLRESLPDKAASFAPTIAAGIRDTSTALASKALATQPVQKAWREANRLAHQQIVKILKGKGRLISTKNGEVSIETGPLTAQVRTALDENGIHIFDDVNTLELRDRFVLFKSTDLQHLQLATTILDKLGFWLPVLAFAAGIGAIACSPYRRRTIEILALGIAGTMVLVVTLVAVGRAFYLGAVGNNIAHPIASVPFDALAAPLRKYCRLVFIAALIVWAVAWITASRTVMAREQQAQAVVFDGMRRYARPLAIGGIVAAALVLIAWSQPGPLAVVVILIVLGAWEALLAYASKRPSPPPARTA
jgi:hypothetical protein